MSELRVAVIGAGHMGALHAQKVAALSAEGEPIRLVGVADIARERAEKVAASVSCPYELDHRVLLPHADAAIVAVPTVDHYTVVRNALDAGLDVLVEKPVAATVEEAGDLLRRADRTGRILQVGHLEWFNNAMRVIRDRIRDPRFVEAHRMGPYPDRATDVDIVRDLMIHDLDILQQLLGEEPCRIEAVGIPVLSPNVDIANARVTFPGGCVANLTASRVSSTPMRKIRFFQLDGYFSIDFLEQSAVVVRRRVPEDGGEPRIAGEKVELDRGDALLSQLRAFLRATQSRESPRVDGENGLGALRTALRVVESMPPWGDYAS